MFSGEIGSLQPRTSYAVARTIGSREMAQHAPPSRIDQTTIKTTTFAAHLSCLLHAFGRRTHLSFRGRRHGGCEPGRCWRLGDRLKQSRSIVGHAIDRGRNFVGFEEIFARRREQRSGGHTASTLAQSSQKSEASSGRITGMRWWMGCSAQGGRQAVFADVPHLRGEGSGAEMRVDAAGGGKGQLKGTIQDCSIEVGRCFRLSPSS